MTENSDKPVSSLCCQKCHSILIEWECLNCKILLCTLCKQEHYKSAEFRNHDITRNLTAGTGLNVRSCRQHGSEKNSLFCNTCEVLICQICLANEHLQHDCSVIKSVLQTKLKELKDIRQEVEDTLESLQLQKKNLDRELVNNQTKINEQTERMQDAERRVLDEIKAKTESMKTSLEQKWNDVQFEISTAKGELEHKQSALRENARKIDVILNSNDIEEVNEILASTKGTLSTISKISLEWKVPEFIENTSATVVIGRLTNSFDCHDAQTPNVHRAQQAIIQRQRSEILYRRDDQKTNIRENKPPINGRMQSTYAQVVKPPDIGIVSEAEKTFKVLGIYGLNLNHITSIACTMEDDNTCVYAVSRFKASVNKISLKSQQERKIAELPSRSILSMAVLKPGCILFITEGDFNVRMLSDKTRTFSRSRKDKIFHSFIDYQEPLSICISENKNVTVATTQKVVDTRLNKMFTLTGKPALVLNEFQIPIQKTYLPVKIASSNTGDILVIMKESVDDNADGIVCCLNMIMDGTLRWHFEGPNNDTSGFYPTDITTTSLGNVVMCDYTNHRLYMTNHHGKLLHDIDTRQLGIGKPLSIDIHLTFMFVGADSDGDVGLISTLSVNNY